ncbi:smc6 [Candida theae]|uniref:Smc6 n=1 Tax=Candida theae TaxID=1198502 RepID=A0AAD5FXV3_9ASCO|nr:smc6 [Candida theae]KAI5956031.1 smc6 [Candida theae]
MSATSIKRPRDNTFNHNDLPNNPSQHSNSTVSQPRKKRAMMTQVPMDENKEDSVSASDEEYDSQESDTEEYPGDDGISPAPGGVIEHLSLKNFMCHDSFELSLGPQINFIIGRNGSGKSAILTGISVGLGAKAHDTNRGSSIRDLIKDGKSTSRISITLKNEGPIAYKPEEFGKKIIIERKLQRVGANTYAIKNESGKTVSHKKAVLDEILFRFNITVDNPLAFLSQDKAREFLTSATAKTKFEYFMSGAYITDIYQNYDEIKRNLLDVKSRLKHAEKYTEVCQAEFERVAQMQNAHRKNDHFRALAKKITGKVHWFNVQQLENKMEEYVAKVADQESQVEIFKQRIQHYEQEIIKEQPQEEIIREKVRTAEADLSSATKRYEEAKEELRTLKFQLDIIKEDMKKNEREIKNLNTNIQYTQSKLQNERRKIEEQEGGSKEEIRNQLAEVDEQLAKSEEDMAVCRQKMKALQSNPDSRLEELTSARDASGRNLRELRSRQAELEKEQFSRYTPWDARKIQGVMRDIDRCQWQSKPIGPLGSYITVKREFQNWKPLLDAILSKSLDAFIVRDERDRAQLDRILKQHHMSHNIIVRKTERYHYESGKAKATTVLDMLNISEDAVLYALIDNSSIEKLVIARSAEEARKMCYEPNVYGALTQFGNSSGSRVSRQGSVLRSDPVYYSGKLPRFGTENKEELLSELKDEINMEIQNQQSMERELRGLKSNVDSEREKLYREQNELRRLVDSLRRKKAVFEDKIDKEIDESNILKLQLRIEEDTAQVSRLEGVHESLEERLEEDNEKYNASAQSRKSIKEDVEDKNSKLHIAVTALETHQEYIKKIRDEIVELQEKKQILIQSIEKINTKMQRAKELIEQESQVAQEKCNRDEVIITEGDTQETIREEFDEVQEKIKKGEQALGTTLEEVLKAMEAADKKREVALAREGELKDLIQRMDREIAVRVAFFEVTIKHAVSIAKRSFEDSMEIRGFRGELMLDFEQGTLDLLVKTKTDDKNRTVESLSGGEKSYTQIALLLAIWQTMNSRIRGLDEFDVYMDSVNRSISIKLLLHELDRYSKSQNIFITPQDIAVVGNLTGDNVKIHKMSDPRRDN